jgi:hypothetical protein
MQGEVQQDSKGNQGPKKGRPYTYYQEHTHSVGEFGSIDQGREVRRQPE